MFTTYTRKFICCATLVSAILLGACNLPARSTPTPSGASLLYTAAAQTVQAQLTQASQPQTAIPLATTPPASTWTQIAFASATLPLAPSTQPPPASTPTPLPCDRAKFIADVTIPDGTSIKPGQVFVKTWRLQNAGSCTWNPAYTLVVEGQNIFNAPSPSPITLTNASVPPGSNIDISISLTAPLTGGDYKGTFKLANPAGQKFGIGDGSKPFWAQIKVQVPTGIVFDLLAQASQAEWKSGNANNLDTALAFGGPQDNPGGAAMIVNNVLLETGSTSGKILLTVPRAEENGAVAGTFPVYFVQPGDHLRARLGFLANLNGTCGAGKVRFQIAYLEGGVTQVLNEWAKSCDGKLLSVDIDLTALKGKNIQIIFLVKADGPATDDWAIWNSPRIER
ncbi:MAG: NBR1-Ig-like domain-containing protein [Chloroflexota bacterium]